MIIDLSIYSNYFHPKIGSAIMYLTMSKTSGLRVVLGWLNMYIQKCQIHLGWIKRARQFGWTPQILPR